MPKNLAVLQHDGFGLQNRFGALNGVSLSFCGETVGGESPQAVLAFIAREVIEARFGTKHLSREDANLLVDSHKDAIGALILEKYATGKVVDLVSNTGEIFPMVLLTRHDMQRCKLRLK